MSHFFFRPTLAHFRFPLSTLCRITHCVTSWNTRLFIQAGKTSPAVFISLIFDMTIAALPVFSFPEASQVLNVDRGNFVPSLLTQGYPLGREGGIRVKIFKLWACLPGVQGVCWIYSLRSILKKIFCKLHLRAF